LGGWGRKTKSLRSAGATKQDPIFKRKKKKVYQITPSRHHSTSTKMSGRMWKDWGPFMALIYVAHWIAKWHICCGKVWRFLEKFSI
jgi:hypothetical protein